MAYINKGIIYYYTTNNVYEIREISNIINSFFFSPYLIAFLNYGDMCHFLLVTSDQLMITEP